MSTKVTSSAINICNYSFCLFQTTVIWFYTILINCLIYLIYIPFKDFFASVQRASKPDNNRTPGEGTCFELGNINSENTNTYIIITLLKSKKKKKTFRKFCIPRKYTILLACTTDTTT